MPHHHSFLTRLRRASKTMQAIPPEETRTITLHANYGDYRIVIGPEYAAPECRTRHLRPHTRPIEIYASIDHLIVEGDQIKPMPDRAEIDHHMQGTVIIHGVAVHIYDADGEGSSPRLDPAPTHGVEIAEAINLAGPDGERAVETLRATGRLTQQAYRIIQHDILRTLLRQRQEVTLAES